MSQQPDWGMVSETIGDLYDSIAVLEETFPGRRFTMDGHLAGSIGEVIAADMFDLALLPGSAETHDATAPDGRLVQVKFTQGRTLGLRSEPDFAVVLHKPKGVELRVAFNGPGHLIWNECGPMQKNGAGSISVYRAVRADERVAPADRIVQVRRSPV